MNAANYTLADLKRLTGNRVCYNSIIGELWGDLVRAEAFGLLVRFDDNSTQWCDDTKIRFTTELDQK